MRYELIDKTQGGRCGDLIREHVETRIGVKLEADGFLIDGEALHVRDVLLAHGLAWGEDFYLRPMDGREKTEPALSFMQDDPEPTADEEPTEADE